MGNLLTNGVHVESVTQSTQSCTPKLEKLLLEGPEGTEGLMPLPEMCDLLEGDHCSNDTLHKESKHENTIDSKSASPNESECVKENVVAHGCENETVPSEKVPNESFEDFVSTQVKPDDSPGICPGICPVICPVICNEAKFDLFEKSEKLAIEAYLSALDNTTRKGSLRKGSTNRQSRKAKKAFKKLRKQILADPAEKQVSRLTTTEKRKRCQSKVNYHSQKEVHMRQHPASVWNEQEQDDQGFHRGFDQTSSRRKERPKQTIKKIPNKPQVKCRTWKPIDSKPNHRQKNRQIDIVIDFDFDLNFTPSSP